MNGDGSYSAVPWAWQYILEFGRKRRISVRLWLLWCISESVSEMATPLPYVKFGAERACDSQCTGSWTVQPILVFDHWCPGLPMLLALFKARQVDHVSSGPSGPMMYAILDPRLRLNHVSEIPASSLLYLNDTGNEKATLGICNHLRKERH